MPRHSLYSGSKGAIDSFVRILSKDCGDKKITVNAVAPGGTVTDMFHDVSHHYIPNGEKYSAEERQQVSYPGRVALGQTRAHQASVIPDGSTCVSSDQEWISHRCRSGCLFLGQR